VTLAQLLQNYEPIYREFPIAPDIHREKWKSRRQSCVEKGAYCSTELSDTCSIKGISVGIEHLSEKMDDMPAETSVTDQSGGF
jgi:hypothetical protein